MTLLLILGAVLIVFGMVQTASGATVGGSGRAQRLADATAVAEGAYVADSRPARNNNPGDLMNWAGSGYPSDPGGYAIFPDFATGMSALVRKYQWILASADPAISALAASDFGVTDTSALTIAQLAQIYSPSGADSWAQNVAAELGVSVDAQIGSV